MPALLAKLQTLAPAYAERGVELLHSSTDPENIAQRTIEENGWTLPVAHNVGLFGRFASLYQDGGRARAP